MKNRLILLIVVFATVFLCQNAYSQTRTCNRLKGKNKSLATKLISKQHPYNCCDDTIARCLKQKPVCSLAYRLAENICRRVADGQNEAEIVRGLSRRAQYILQSTSPAKIDLTGISLAGNANAPITLVEYACPRCPYCAIITPSNANGVMKPNGK